MRAQVRAPARRAVAGVVLIALLALVAAPPITGALSALASTDDGVRASAQDLQTAIEAMRAAEAEALRLAPTVSAQEGATDRLRERLDVALRDAGAQLRSLDAPENVPAAAGLLRRRFALRASCPPAALAAAFAAIRKTVPELIVEHTTIDLAGASAASPDPQLVIEGVLWVTPQTAGPS